MIGNGTKSIGNGRNALSDEVYAEIIEPLARRLTEIQQDQDQALATRAWTMAATYVQAYQEIQEIHRHLGVKVTSQSINRAIRQFDGYQGPGIGWLSHALRVYEVFPDFFVAGDKKRSDIAYDSIKSIANCHLPSRRDNHELLDWYLDVRPTRADLRAEIRRRVDAQKGINRPDFDLKVTNTWKFSQKAQRNGFDGGISPDLVANLLYYYTDPGDVIIDPMAGGDTTYQVISHYAFFSDPNCQADFAGPRSVYRSDIAPRHNGIEEADVTKSLPWPDNFADFCLLDPPYYGIANGKYANFGATIEEWITNLSKAIQTVLRVLKPGGLIAVISDDYLRAREFQPIAFLVFDRLRQAGLQPKGTIYNAYPNFVTTMGPAQMWQAKRSRLQVSEMKIVHVFEKSVRCAQDMEDSTQ